MAELTEFAGNFDDGNRLACVHVYLLTSYPYGRVQARDEWPIIRMKRSQKQSSQLQDACRHRNWKCQKPS
jgi:hypothetical protein